VRRIQGQTSCPEAGDGNGDVDKGATKDDGDAHDGDNDDDDDGDDNGNSMFTIQTVHRRAAGFELLEYQILYILAACTVLCLLLSASTVLYFAKAVLSFLSE
jgi:hypothetical protein